MKIVEKAVNPPRNVVYAILLQNFVTYTSFFFYHLDFTIDLNFFTMRKSSCFNNIIEINSPITPVNLAGDHKARSFISPGIFRYYVVFYGQLNRFSQSFHSKIAVQVESLIIHLFNLCGYKLELRIFFSLKKIRCSQMLISLLVVCRNRMNIRSRLDP